MPYRLNASGQIECDTAVEALALMGTTPATGKKAGKKGRKTGAGEAISKSWADARVLAAAEGITVKEARSRLKNRKAEPELVPIHGKKKRTPRKKMT
jgi:hypothetical protein